MKEKTFYRLRNCIIVLIIMSILLYIFLNFLNYKNSKIEEKENLELKKEIQEEYTKDKYIPSGCYIFVTKYEGEINDDELYKNIYTFVNYISEIYPTIQKEDKSYFKSYFDENSKKIESITGISEYDEFIKIIEYLKNEKQSGDIGEYQSSSFDTKTIETKNRWIEVNLNIKYSNLSNALKFKVIFMNEQKEGQPIVKYSVI